MSASELNQSNADVRQLKLTLGSKASASWEYAVKAFYELHDPFLKEMLEKFDATVFLDESQVSEIEKWAQPKVKQALKSKLGDSNVEIIDLWEFFDEEVITRKDFEALVTQWEAFVSSRKLPKLQLDEWQKNLAFKKIGSYLKEYEPDLFGPWILINKMLLISKNLNEAYRHWQTARQRTHSTLRT